ncbi:MAG: hypothetical protein ACFFC7_26880 [Candidatus Hermodarchaeota archaeon]
MYGKKEEQRKETHVFITGSPSSNIKVTGVVYPKRLGEQLVATDNRVDGPRRQKWCNSR